ncbi:MAG: rod shape-determining protein MreD [Pseudomonadota bacterium]
MSEPTRAYWVLPLTFFLALTLMAFPLDRPLSWYRPEWVLLFLVYWAIALPHRVGLVTALALGLLLDVLKGAAIGQSMLSFAIVVTLARLMYQRLRVFSLLQQSGVLFLMVGVHQLIAQWVLGLQGAYSPGFAFLLPALTSALIWPLVFFFLRALRRSQGVR